MSDLLIKGMEMPKPKLANMTTVYNAYVLVSQNGHAVIVVGNENGLDSTEYPLVPVPPHGRLINADTLINDYPRTWTTYDLQRIANAPTIIPASEEDES